MASAFGVLLILLGGFVMAIGYGMVSVCLGRVSEGYSGLCWNPTPWNNQYASGALGVLVGAIVASLGAILLVSPNVAKLLAKLRGSGQNSGS